MPLLTAGRALNLALAAPEAAEHTKRYHKQQRRQRKRVSAPHAPGGAPPMRKVSAKQALNFYLKKTAKAGVPGVREFGKGLGWAAGIGAATLAGRAGGKGVANTYQRFASNRMFDQLKRRYPEIRRNDKKAREAFDLAITYAPSLMRHPTAIGDFVRRQLEFPMSSHEYLKQLADLEATVSKSEASGAPAQFGSSLGQAAGLAAMLTPPAPKGS